MSRIITESEQHVLATAKSNLGVVIDQVKSMDNDLFAPIVDDLEDASTGMTEILESVA